MPASAEELVELLSLETIDRNLFRGRQPDTTLQRVFGGQVAAQALIAACRTVDERYRAHSLHSYFLLPGDTAVPIVYDVEQLRDGRSFATRRVVARQHGRAIFFLTASFQVEEPGFDHQDAMPETPGPDQGVALADLVRAQGREEGERFAREWAALDVRYVGIAGRGLPDDPSRPARARLWIRVNGELSDDPVQHLAAFTYASDLTLLGATLGPARRDDRQSRAAARLARPRDVVPPPVPGRRVVALRPALAVGAGCARAGAGPGLHPGRDAGLERRPGGADPAARTVLSGRARGHCESQHCSFRTAVLGGLYGGRAPCDS